MGPPSTEPPRDAPTPRRSAVRGVGAAVVAGAARAAQRGQRRRRGGGRLAAIIAGGVVLLAGGAYGAGYAMAGETLPPKTVIEGVPVGGLAPADAEAKLTQELAAKADAPNPVTPATTGGDPVGTLPPDTISPANTPNPTSSTPTP